MPAKKKARKKPPASRKPRLQQPKIQFAETQSLIAEISEWLSCPLICYWMPFNGAICGNDVHVMHELMGALPTQDQAFLYVKSAGGEGMAALRLVHLLRHRIKRLVILAPQECESAATMLALGGDEIWMSPLSQLSAVDTSLTHPLSPIDHFNNKVSVSMDELQRVIRLWQEARSDDDGKSNPYADIYKYIHPLVLGAVDRSSSLSIKLCQEILSYHMTDKQKIEGVSRALNSDYPAHAYPITIREARRLGLNVSEIPAEIQDLLNQLNNLYCTMTEPAFTDFDENNYHDNSILNILETREAQYFFQKNEDNRYRAEERRWETLHKKTNWYRIRSVDGKPVKTKLPIT